MNFGEWIANAHKEAQAEGLPHIPRIECNDGFSLSVQVGKYLYSTPQVDGAEEYISVEVGYPSEDDELLYDHMDGEGEIGAFVPVAIVAQVIEKHGGMI